MTGAMYAAISGLKTHMDKLNVISNNVANANTNGYKSSRATFMESLYTTVRSGSNGTSMLGGNNPSQIGYGCSIGTIDLDMSTKNYSPTGRPMDCMINGDGFFMLGDKNPAEGPVNPAALNLGRVGNFEFIDGYLVDGQGNVVYGFLTCAPNADGTGKGNAAGSYPAGEVDFTWRTSTVLAPIQLPFAAGTPEGDDDPAAGTAVYPGANGADNVYGTGERVKLEGVSISKTGKISGVNKATKEPVVIGYIALASPDNPNGVTRTESGYYQALDGAGGVGIVAMDDVGGYLNNAEGADGAPAEGATAILTGSAVKLVPNGLESSGTDVATEFSEMITTQRGYQANTRIITVTDSMLEELVNMKR